MGKKDNNIIKIMIVDDHPILRQGLKLIIEREENFSICQRFSATGSSLLSITSTVASFLRCRLGR